MKKLLLVLTLFASISVFPNSVNETKIITIVETELNTAVETDFAGCYAYITRSVYNMMTRSYDSVTTLEYLGEVNESTNWANQIACNFRASITQAIAN